MDSKNLIVNTGTSGATSDKNHGSETARTAAKEAESKLQSELDVVCNFLEILDAVDEGDLHWSDEATSVDAVKRAPASPLKGRRDTSEKAK